MAYDVNTGMITGEVSVHDVQQALDTSENRVGALHGFGEIADKINKWAKYKPVYNTQKFYTGQAEKVEGVWEWKESADWWKGSDNKCGIEHMTYNTFTDCMDAIDNQTAVWSYNRGSTTAPYRLADYLQYNHNARAPFSSFDVYNIDTSTQKPIKVSFEHDQSQPTVLQLSDLGITNFYITVAFFEKSGTTRGACKLIHSFNKKLGDLADSEEVMISIPYEDTDTGGYHGKLVDGRTYYMYAFLSQLKYTIAETPNSDHIYNYIPLPTTDADYGLQRTEVTITNTTTVYRIIIDPTPTENNHVVNWEIRMYHGTTSTQGTLFLYVRDNRGTWQKNGDRNVSFANAGSGTDEINDWAILQSVFFSQLG